MKIDRRRCPHPRTTLAQRIRRAFLPTLAAAILPMSVLAAVEETVEQDLTLIPFEQLMKTEVVSASKLARQVSDAPSAVSIVTAEDIRAYGYRNLADVIKSFPGLYSTSDRNYEYMVGRGLGNPGDYSGRVMLMIDGYPTQDNIFSQVFLGNDGILDIELIERVEYIPGTGAVTYGQNAMLGVINIITKTGRDFNGTQVSLGYGSYGEQKQILTYGKQLENGTDLLFSISTLKSDGDKHINFPEYNSENKNFIHAINKDGDQNNRLFAKITQDNLTLEFGHVRRKKEIPTGSRDGSAPSLPFNSDDESNFLNINHNLDLENNLKLTTRSYYGDYRNKDFYQYMNPFLKGSDPVELKFKSNNHLGTWLGVDQKFVYTGLNNQILVVGWEIRSDTMQFQRSRLHSDYSTSQFYDVYNNERITTSFYLEDNYVISRNWQINAGIRHDQTSDNFSATSPRIALINNLTDRTTIKASISKGFRFPSTYDSWYSINATKSYSAIPEFVIAKEIVVAHQITHNSRLTGTVYNYSSENIYDKQTRDQQGKNQATGFETTYEHIFSNRRSLRASLSGQRAFDNNGQLIPNVPSYMGKIGFYSPINTNIQSGIEVQQIGQRESYEHDQKLPAFNTANLTFSTTKKWNGISGFFSIKNIFDRHYPVVAVLADIDEHVYVFRPSILRDDGRSFWLKVSYDF